MLKKEGQKGFTLLEFVMVIILLGILASVAIPKFIDLSTDARDGAIDATYGAVQSAISIYIAKNKVVPPQATFDTDVLADVTLTGDLSFGAYTAATGEFYLQAGASGAGRRALATYSDAGGSPSLTLAPKGVWP